MTKRQLFKLFFHRDSVGLIASLVFFWFTISLLIDSTIGVGDLVQHPGVIVSMDSVITKVVDKPLFKEITKELRLTIDSEEECFVSISTKGFYDITSRIATGDSVIVFTKPRVWGIFGLTKKRNISQLLKGREVIIDYDKYKEKISGLFILTLIGSVVFFIWYFGRARKRYYFDIVDGR